MWGLVKPASFDTVVNIAPGAWGGQADLRHNFLAQYSLADATNAVGRRWTQKAAEKRPKAPGQPHLFKKAERFLETNVCLTWIFSPRTKGWR
jgi:hypothetical protein